MPYLLKPSFQSYSWGDKSYIQKLCGLDGSFGQPLAEMWLGAHPSAPGIIVTSMGEIPLDEFIALSPEKHLGRAVQVYTGKLPFLMKVLAAAKPLSIQVHPDKLTAEQGFAIENLAGIAPEAPNRSFKDDNHKPELVLAITPYSLMLGFRDYEQIVSLIKFYGLEEIWEEFQSFVQWPSKTTLGNLFRQVLDSTKTQLEFVLHRMTSRIMEHETDFISKTVLELNTAYPLDTGIVGPLLLNTFILHPGQAVYLNAGVPHAYIKGAGIELMANSDNVIRAGLTNKFVDIEQLLKVADFNPSLPLILNKKKNDKLNRYRTPFIEFELISLELDGKEWFNPANSPAILLCLEGKVAFGNDLEIGQGQAAFISASESELTLSGKANLAIAIVPLIP